MDEYGDTALYNATEETLRCQNLRKGLNKLQFRNLLIESNSLSSVNKSSRTTEHGESKSKAIYINAKVLTFTNKS